MAVKIKVGADLSPAQAEVNKFQQATGAAGKQAGEALAAGVETGAKKSVASLGNIEASAKKAGDAASKSFDLQKINAAIGALGAFKEVWNGVATSVLDFKEATAQSVSSAIDASAKAAQLGAAFGPLGTSIAAATGYLSELVGQLKAFSKEHPETAKKIQELTTGKEGSFLQGSAAARGFGLALSAIAKGDLPDTKKAAQELGYAIQVDLINKMKQLRKEAEEAEAKARDFAIANKTYEDPTMLSEQDKIDLNQRQYKLKLRDDEAAVTIAKAKKAGQTAAEEFVNELTALIQEQQDMYAHFAAADAEYAQKKKKEAATLASDLERIQAEARETQTQNEEARLKSVADRLAFEAAESKRLYDLKKSLEEEDLANAQEVLEKRTQQLQAYGAVAQEVFSAIGAQLEKNIAEEEKLTKGLGIAIEAATGSVLKGLGRQFVVKGLGEVAEGIAASASVILAPTAPGHFAAAAAYGIAAGAAGVGGVLLSGDAGRRTNDIAEAEAAAASGSSGGSSSGGGASSGGTATATELAGINLFLAPGGTVVFPSDPRGMSQFGRFTQGAQASANKANTPKINR